MFEPVDIPALHDEIYHLAHRALQLPPKSPTRHEHEAEIRRLNILLLKAYWSEQPGAEGYARVRRTIENLEGQLGD